MEKTNVIKNDTNFKLKVSNKFYIKEFIIMGMIFGLFSFISLWFLFFVVLCIGFAIMNFIQYLVYKNIVKQLEDEYKHTKL